MPELPDITVYVEALERRLKDQVIEEVRLASPFLLRTVEPSLDEAIGKKVVGGQTPRQAHSSWPRRTISGWCFT